LSGGEINALVARLQESQKKHQQQLLQKQAERQAEETAHSFKPLISERSKVLAAKNKSLPERVEALLLKKKKRLDDIKQEREQKELEEATFRPAVNRERPATAGGALGGDDGGRRAVGHLMQYEVDRRIRAEQRKLLIAEVEGRDLTFSPALNNNSIRIVERLKEAARRAGADTSGAGAAGAGATFRSAHAAPTPLVHSAPAHSDAAETERRRREAREANEEYRRLAAQLPGHEQETFRPHIDERSKALAGRAIARQFGAEDVGVTARLAMRTKGRGVSGVGGVASPAARLAASGSGAGREVPSENQPSFFNSVPFDPSGKHDFVLRRFLHGGSA
jgi:hypothetical protein